MVEEDLVVAEEVEDRVGDGVFNKTRSKINPDISLWIINVGMSIERVVIWHKYWKKKGHGKAQ